LRDKYIKKNDPEYERKPTPQARPNVLFEAGMAFGLHFKKVVFIQHGNLRPFTDIAGLHILSLDDTAQSRTDFVSRLRNAGCSITGSLFDKKDWLKVGNFAPDTDQQVNPVTNKHDIKIEEEKRHREELIKEMDQLIGPLHSKIGRYQTLEPIYLDDKTEDEARIFWEKIRENEYLAQLDLKTLIDYYMKIMLDMGAEYKKARQHLSRAISERYSELSNQHAKPDEENEFLLIEQQLRGKMAYDIIQPVPLADRENTEWLKFWDKNRQNKTIQGTDLKIAMNEYYDAINNGQIKARLPRISLEDAVKKQFENNSKNFRKRD
jgi:hypothetical protein